MQTLRWLPAGLCLLLLTGCDPAGLRTPERMSQGYVLVLPGIEGRSYLNTSIAKGLADGGVPSAIEVYDWTPGVLLFGMAMRDDARNRRQAGIIARKILDYQAAYPGRPVHLVGHSGGGGMAVLALQALPPGHQIASAILLAPAIAPGYNLVPALSRTQYGIWNYYSAFDVAWLGAGTIVVGTMDGEHTSAAGAVGFTMAPDLDEEARAQYGKLHQVPYDPKMADSGHLGNHFGWAHRGFVATWLAPIVQAQIQPPH